jgi:hypothetical protein
MEIPFSQMSFLPIFVQVNFKTLLAKTWPAFVQTFPVLGGTPATPINEVSERTNPKSVETVIDLRITPVFSKNRLEDNTYKVNDPLKALGLNVY